MPSGASRTRSLPLVRVALLAVAVAVAAQGRTASAADSLADLAGTWTLSYETPDGDRVEPVLKLSAEGDKAKGTLTTEKYGKFDVEEVAYKEGSLRFRIKGEIEGQDIVVTYQAMVKKDELVDGSFDYEYGGNTGTVDFKGKCAEAPKADAVLGTWDLSIETPNGRTLEPSITVSKQDGGLKGAYDSKTNGEMPVKSISFKDGELAFEIVGDANGQEFTINYKGKVEGDSIKGDVDYKFGDNAGTIEFTGMKKGS